MVAQKIRNYKKKIACSEDEKDVWEAQKFESNLKKVKSVFQAWELKKTCFGCSENSEA